MTSLDPFVTLQDLSDYLGRDVSADNGAVMAMDAACDVIRDLTEQDFNMGTTTVTLDGTGTDCIVLPQRPVSSVTTVTIGGGTVTDYLPASPDGFLYRGTVSGPSDPFLSSYVPPTMYWPRGRQNVRITYIHGYASTDVPRSIRMVAISLASRLIVQGPALIETIGDVTMNYGMQASDLTANELRVLQGYLATRSY